MSEFITVKENAEKWGIGKGLLFWYIRETTTER